MPYLSYKLEANDRDRKLAQISPTYPHLKADHITHIHGGFTDDGDIPSMPKPAKVEAIGIVTDNHGIEALVVQVNGKRLRPDGEAYHCTWSYDPTKAPHASLTPHMRPHDREEKTYRSQHSRALMHAAFDASGTLRADAQVTFTPFRVPVTLRTQATHHRDDDTTAPAITHRKTNSPTR